MVRLTQRLEDLASGGAEADWPELAALARGIGEALETTAAAGV